LRFDAVAFGGCAEGVETVAAVGEGYGFEGFVGEEGNCKTSDSIVSNNAIGTQS